MQGNGRSLFTPKVDGTPWIRGAVGCSEWTGVRLRDVLKAAGLKETAIYTGNYGADLPIGSGEPFSRGIPIEKAMDEHTLIALKMNRRGFTRSPRIPRQIDCAGLDWQFDAEMAQPYLDQRSNLRLRKDDRVFLSRTDIPAGARG